MQRVQRDARQHGNEANGDRKRTPLISSYIYNKYSILPLPCLYIQNRIELELSKAYLNILYY